MTDLHLIISPPEPGAWHGRLDVIEALEAAGWTGDDDMPLSIVRHPSGAVYAVQNERDDSGLDCPNGTVIEFPGDTPTVVIVAACLAAAAAAGESGSSADELSTSDADHREPCGEGHCRCYGTGAEHADCACGCDCPRDEDGQPIDD